MSSIQRRVTIGIDPHPTTHTAAALDENGKVLESLTVNHSSIGLRKLEAWAKSFQKRRSRGRGHRQRLYLPFRGVVTRGGRGGLRHIP